MKVRARLEKLVANSALKPGDFGMWVGRGSDLGIETYYTHNSDQQFIPASLSKLITLATVLHELPGGYKFKTQLLSDADFRDGRLVGPIYLKGGGRPFIRFGEYVGARQRSDSRRRQRDHR